MSENGTRTDARRPDELLTAGQVASMLGVNPSAVSNWRKRSAAGKIRPRAFPEPWLEIVTATPYRTGLFVREEVEAWAADRAAYAAERRARRIASLERQLAKARGDG